MIARRSQLEGSGCEAIEATTKVPLVPLAGKDKRALRARAHHLNPVVSVGAAGLSDALLAELERALEDHELVKLRITAERRDERDELIETLCRRTGAELVQRIGHTATIYRQRPQ